MQEIQVRRKPMFKKERKTSKGLKILLVISFILIALFIVFLMLYATMAGDAHDADLKDFGAVMKYHVEGFKGLFTFKFHDASNVVYFSLSALLYGLIAIWVIFLVVGILIAVKKKRRIMVAGIVLTLLVIIAYMFGATGLPKYWLIINGREAFKDANLLRFLACVLIFSDALFALLAYISYFACVLESFKNPRKEIKEEKAEDSEQEELPTFEEEPAPEGEEAVMFEQIEAEPEPENNAAPYVEADAPKQEQPEERLDKNELADLIRNIVRDEMVRNAPNPHNPGPGPLVVQYFGSAPIQQEVVQPKPAPKKEEKKEPVAKISEEEEIKVHDKIVPEEDKAPEYKIVAPKKKEKPAPAPVEAPVEKNKIIRIPFQERMLNADDEMKRNYNELKNEILSYGVNSRVSNSGDAFRLHRKTYVKITIAGLSLKLYFALNPDDYKDSTIPVQNAGHKGIYEEIPLVFKVKSGLSMRRAKELIQTVMDQGGLEQGAIGDTDWVEKLKEQPADADEANED